MNGTKIFIACAGVCLFVTLVAHLIIALHTGFITVLFLIFAREVQTN